MKLRHYFIPLLLLPLFSSAQNIHLSYGLGTGSAYVFENIDQGVDIDYSLPFATYAGLKYSIPNAYFDVMLNFQYQNSGITGKSWKTGGSIEGEVSSFTSSVLLEHLEETKKWNFGYNFGLGYSNENYSPSLSYSVQSELRNYLSFTLSGIMSYQLSENLQLQMVPSLFWSDVVNSLRSSDHWNIAREDLSFLGQLGISYRLK